MSTVPSVFPLWRIALTAVISLVASLALLLWRFKKVSVSEAAFVSLVVGTSVLLWRLAGNTGLLNDDPIPPLSPNDLLCPIVTYVFLGLYTAFRCPSDPTQWNLARAWLTVISFVVNVLFI